jgi:hypothetical protein
MRFKDFIISTAAVTTINAPTAYCQNYNTAATISSFLGAGTTAVNTLNSMAAQHQALESQREQMQTQRQQQDNASEQRALERERLAAQRYHCPGGYIGAVIIHAAASKSLICEEKQQ